MSRSRLSRFEQIADRLTAGWERLRHLGILRRIGTATRLLLQGDLAAIRSRWRHRIPSLPKERLVLDLEPAHSVIDPRHQTPVRLPQSITPLVSIILQPSIQQHAIHCALRSIYRHEPDLTFEIILIDDLKRERPPRLAEPATGLIPAPGCTEDSWGARCNQAAAQARGQYLCFLGPSLQIQKNTITALVETIDARPECALAGAKIVRPDGTLLDAGRIVWNDGSVDAYGGSDDPMEPEYNYLRECDTVSHLLFMVPQSAWCEVGGFQPTFSAGPYSVADLAYRLRAAGRVVLYQPEALAVDTVQPADRWECDDPSTSTPEADRLRFCAAWSRVLADEALPVRTDVLRARERSSGRKTVVLIDQHVPMPDRDAGSRTIFQYLTLASELGYKVKFVSHDFIYDPAYRGALERLGIEILAGKRFQASWRAWFRNMNDHLHAVIFCRPHVTEMFFDAVSDTCPTARRIYYGHDLHWVREEREYAVTGDEKFAHRAREWKRRECSILGRMDCNLSVSTEESRLVATLFPHCQQVVWPIFYWADLSRLEATPEGRRGYLFVGGFAHRPNTDGLLWFLDSVWPLIRLAIPDAIVRVVGSNAPPIVTSRNDAGLVFHGHVDDATLSRLYCSSRVAIVPLRYGAGVKGKTVEAMRNGLPVVSTRIGIEGLDDLPLTIAPTDDAAAFASTAVSLHEDRSLWARHVADQFAFVRRSFSRERAKRCLVEAIEGNS
jgi:glycosyltransferase involved in cell wall biosynthesis